MRFLSASRIFSGTHVLTDPSVLVLKDDGRIEDLLPAGSVDTGRVEFHEGILAPGFINTHCHLELSHLKGKIPQGTGIVDFGLSVIRQRNGIGEEEQLEHMRQADKDMRLQGIVAVGDISNTALSAPVKQQSGLYYHSFVELIALHPGRAGLVFDAGKATLETFRQAGLSASLAPHAPYSCSRELIAAISAFCYQEQQPTSIHNQESQAENDFFIHKTGDYVRMYNTLGLPIDYFEASGKSSLQNVAGSFHKGVNTLLVHNTFSDKKDVTMAEQLLSELYWCLCPNANLYIEGVLPDALLLASQHCKLTLGTDSLASNARLSVLEEILALQKHIPGLPLELLLNAATLNGARFLGIDETYGSLEKGKTPGINIIHIEKGLVKKLA